MFKQTAMALACVLSLAVAGLAGPQSLRPRRS